MARRYYNSVQDIYTLFINHPSLSQMLSEFQISTQGVKEVAEFLYNNDSKIQQFKLHTLFDWGTSETLEPDQPSPNAIYVNTREDLPDESQRERSYYVIDEDRYYKYENDEWIEDTNFQTFTRDEYKKYQQRTGFLIWENERSYYILSETDDELQWTNLGNMYNGNISGSVIRKSDLPMDGIEVGDVYEVRGEDLLDVIAVLYGFTAPEYHPPWGIYESTRSTNLLELLKFTIYYYRYATVDNFYEEHIFDFIPEYDRNYILSKPKMKLFLEGVGRNLDNIEDKISRIPDLYNLDEVPDELLDYVGQILGYEREDFSLANLSFRELLKNIIDIYKIKGTNYSFSFFFKFLGFNVNLKEFYFNRDVTNPESFPGVDHTKVEYYLTTNNPIFDTTNNNPAEHLRQIRNLNEWEYELTALENAGCQNPINYMLGIESYNGTNKWHSNPWTYFKTNLIEYQLDPFMDKISLTASDNETIRKYIRFLSPTYLFTWVNVNLKPWIDTYDVHIEMEEKLNLDIQKTMGDYVNPETGEIYQYINSNCYLDPENEQYGTIYLYSPSQDTLEKLRDSSYIFQDYENMQSYLDVYEKESYYQWNNGEWIEVGITNNVKKNVNFYSDLLSETGMTDGDIYHVYGGERITQSIVLNNPEYDNINSDKYTGYDTSDRVGTILKRDGTHIRQPGHPNFIDNMKHNGSINLTFDNLNIYIKDTTVSTWDYEVNTYNDLPIEPQLMSLAYVLLEGETYVYKKPNNYWREISIPDSSIVYAKVNEKEELPTEPIDVSELELGTIFYIINEETYYTFRGLDADKIWTPYNILTNTYISGILTFKSQLESQVGVHGANENHEFGSIYYINTSDTFYEFVETDPDWFPASIPERYYKWNDFSFRPFPAVPVKVEPYPGTNLYTNDPIISWENVSHHTGFKVEISLNLSFNDIIISQELSNTETMLSLNNLSNGDYYWRISSKNEFGNYGEWSNIFDFTIESLPYPFDGEILDRETHNVVLVKDNNIIIGVNINFQWEEVYDATNYEIEFSRYSDFDTVDYKEYTTNNNTKITLPNGRDYYWRIRAQKDEWLDWQGPYHFKTRF